MNRYEAIYIRKSVRRYSRKAVPSLLIQQIENCAQRLNFLEEESNCSVRIYNAVEAKSRLKGLFKVSAPYYMAVFAGTTPFALVEAGCYAERLVLYMTTKGLGTCYQGCCQLDPKEVPKGQQLAMIIAFGYAEGKLSREEREAKRQPLSRLCEFQAGTGDEIRTMLRCARLAPSALNRQPWRFRACNEQIEVFVEKDGAVPVRKSSSFSGQLFDMGIVLCHLLEAADELWIPLELVRDEKLAEEEKETGRAKKKVRYLFTLKRKEAI